MTDGFLQPPITSRPRVNIIFEFGVSKPRLTFYRAVRASNGGYRMEKRGALAKKFKAFMWSGSEEGLYNHSRAIEFCLGNDAMFAIVSQPAGAL